MADDSQKKSAVGLEWQAVIGIVSLYIFGHFFLLLNRGFYWDGLYLYRMVQAGDFGLLWANLSVSRAYGLFYLLRFLAPLGDLIVLSKFIVFVSWLAAGLLLYAILRRTFAAAQAESFFIVSLFLLAPLFLSRLELSVLNHSLANLLFFGGAFAYFEASRQSLWRRRIFLAAAFVMFLLSFFTYSILVFYGGFVLAALYDVYRKRKDELTFHRWFFGWCRTNAVFIIAPVAFWLFKLSLGNPYGPAAGYNSFIFDRGPGALASGLVDGLWNGFSYVYWAILAAFSVAERKIFAVLAVAAAFIAYISLRRLWTNERKATAEAAPDSPLQSQNSPTALGYFAAGLIFWFLALIPYVLVGKYPHPFGVMFATRHALLMPLGFSLILTGAISATVRERWRLCAQAALLGIFAAFSIYNYWNFDMDWYRQIALTESLAHTGSAEIRAATTLIFRDDLADFRYFGRNMSGDNYRVFAYNAFPDSPKFAVLENEIFSADPSAGITEQYQTTLAWHMLRYPDLFAPTAKPVEVTVTSVADSDIQTVGEWLALKKCELLCGHDVFVQKVVRDLKISVEPVSAEQSVARL